MWSSFKSAPSISIRTGRQGKYRTPYHFSQKSDEQVVGDGSVSAAHRFLSAALAFFVDRAFADKRQA
jgi:hypothetical protein